MSASEHHSEEHAEHKHPPYALVFIVLAVLTAIITSVELMAQNGVITASRSILNIAYLSMSIAKALLVALFYMHLKNDHFLYSVLFGVPVIFAIVFFALLLV